jgi:hypothetical protein
MKRISEIMLRLSSKLPKPDSWVFWLCLALLIKSFFFAYKVHIENAPHDNANYVNSFAAEHPDTPSYFLPIENLLKNGKYWGGIWEDDRMPGYGWLYLVLRLFLPFTYAANAIVLIQLALSAASVYVLAQIALMIFGRYRYFYATFGLYAISTFTSLYYHILTTESLCTSLLIFSFYFLFKHGKSLKYILLTGAFIAWCVFLKPVMAGILLLFALYILFRDLKKGRIRDLNWKYLFIFLIPFVMLDGAWAYRNYKHYNRIIPLTKTTYYSFMEKSYLVHLVKFQQCYGGSNDVTEPKSDVFFYRPRPFKMKIKVTPPPYIYTSKFNYDSLVMVRDMIHDIDHCPYSYEYKMKRGQIVSAKLDAYAASIKKEKPFLYQVRSRITMFKTYFVHSGTHNLFYKGSWELNKIELLIKVFYSFLYIIVISVGFAGIFYLLFTHFRNADYLLLSLSGLFFAFVFPLLLRMDQIRYFIPGYPIFLLFAVYLLISLVNRILKISNG